MNRIRNGSRDVEISFRWCMTSDCEKTVQHLQDYQSTMGIHNHQRSSDCGSILEPLILFRRYLSWVTIASRVRAAFVLRPCNKEVTCWVFQGSLRSTSSAILANDSPLLGPFPSLRIRVEEIFGLSCCFSCRLQKCC